MRIVLAGTGVLPIPPPGYGGVERTIGELADALRRAGESVEIVNDDGHGRASHEYLFALRLPRRIRALRPDVIHASTPVVANRLALAGLPYVYTTHSRHWFERRGASQRFGFWLERRAVRRSAAPIALTSRLAEQIRTLVGPDRLPRLDVIPIGVDTDRFRPDPARRTGQRAIGVGVVRPFKRWELASEALRGSGFRLTVVGPCPDAEYAARLRASGDGVELTGEVSETELVRRLSESDLLVHPSRVELLAGAVLQGLASGLPVLGAEPVASLLVEGETGFCAPSGADDAGVRDALHTAAVRLARAPEERLRMGEAARRSATETYAWPAVVARHLELYRAVTRPAG